MQFIERFILSYGPAALILVGVVVLFFIIQLIQYARLATLVGYRNSDRRQGRDSYPSVSVIIPLFNEDYGFVEERLPLFLQQNYKNDKGADVPFEVVVVYVGLSSDFHEDLLRIREHYHHLIISRIHFDPRRPISRKMALNIGIKSAQYECMLFSSTDAIPTSENWLNVVARGFERGNVVLSYCGLEELPGLMNTLMRTGRMMHSAEWLSRAASGKPYRGTLHNFGFTKKLYFHPRVKGFNQLGMNIGEDDLFLERIASRKNTSLVLTPRATIRQKVWGGLSWWISERRYYGSAAPFYPSGVRWRKFWEPTARLIFHLSTLLVILLLPLEFKIGAAALWLLRLGWVLFEVKRIARRLGEKRLLGYYPIYDLFSPYWTFVLWCIMLRKDERVWR